MSTPPVTSEPLHTFSGGAGLRVQLHAHGALHRMDCHGVMLNLFVGNTLEGGPANLWLRRHGADGTLWATPLLGPCSPLRPQPGTDRYRASGEWHGVQVSLQLRLSATEPVWYWHVALHNGSAAPHTLDLVLVQDVGLSPYAAARLNEYYVSHYIDFTPLTHDRHGCMLAARQNLAVGGRHPWLLMGSLRRAARRATDARQLLGLAVRAGGVPQGISQGLPGPRLQQEHALIALQDEPFTLAPGGRVDAGFFGHVLADHPGATLPADLAWAEAAGALPEALPPAAQPPMPAVAAAWAATPSLFASAPLLQGQDLLADEIDQFFGRSRRHEEWQGGTLLSFFTAEHSHVVLRAKELQVQRPHGHILRSGAHLLPDETALTSTVWMAGVFHSMVTQGHVSINRFLSTVRGSLGQFRAHGQRVWVRLDGGVDSAAGSAQASAQARAESAPASVGWQQLGVPSAFVIEPAACRWLYRVGSHLIELRSAALHSPESGHALTLQLRVLQGPALAVMVTHHVALAGDDGASAAPAVLRLRGGSAWVGVPPGSELAARFADGGFAIEPEAGTVFERIAGDECVYADGASRGQPLVCVTSAPTTAFGLRLVGHLVQAAAPAPAQAPLPLWAAPAHSPLAAATQQLADIAPWYHHNALVHYLAPRGLEQFSGGGWGTRDVCQGPLEMLLALDRPAPVRDLLQRVFAAQDVGGDWPQWFMFFDRDRHIRAGDSHGDIVFWPLLALARYLLASGDTALLDERVPYFAATGTEPEQATVWHHVQRALGVIQTRRIPGTHLAAYGHGDWNDSLQPADPTLRERLCSAWTVTLHHQVLHTLARALRASGLAALAAPAAALQSEAAAVLADFQRLLVVGGVVTGYAMFAPEDAAAPTDDTTTTDPAQQQTQQQQLAASQLLLHPQDSVTGVHYSLLPMMHAMLDDMLTPEQAADHVRLIDAHLTGPDGARLFNRPMPYRGGPETLFQRAESSAYFGREIGVMYMHAHLRWCETLAHLGQAQRFFDALALAHPIALRDRVGAASLRQANCYFSSSDAAFADRYDAQEHYGRIHTGEVALDGGWRVYSSGPGIAIGLIVGSFLGIRREALKLVVDPVMPAALHGMTAQVPLGACVLSVVYHLGPQGCGPVGLQLDGTPLPFERGANPYRTGAAEVDMVALRARLTGPAHTLLVQTL
jgi:cellobiose phosphorylase